MKLKELKEAIDRVYKHSQYADDLEVVIPNNKGGMGAMSVTNVRSAHRGIDWDSSRFILWPELKMTEIKEKSHE